MIKKMLYVIFICYGQTHVKDSLALLNTFSGRLFPDFRRSVVTVDNMISGDLEILEADTRHLISGDNSGREFTGYDKGIRFVQEYYSPPPESVVLVVNDTFHRSYGTEYMELFEPETVQNHLAEGHFVGYMDAFPQAIELFEISLSTWIRTSMILARMSELTRLSPIMIPFADKEIFADEHNSFFVSPSPLSENYRAYMKTWLFGEQDPSGEFAESWHSQKELNSDSFEFFKNKARSILCEHYFSGRALREGIPMYDVRSQELIT